jgi:hypothetical protein
MEMHAEGTQSPVICVQFDVEWKLYTVWDPQDVVLKSDKALVCVGVESGAAAGGSHRGCLWILERTSMYGTTVGRRCCTQRMSRQRTNVSSSHVIFLG